MRERGRPAVDSEERRLKSKEREKTDVRVDVAGVVRGRGRKHFGTRIANPRRCEASAVASSFNRCIHAATRQRWKAPTQEGQVLGEDRGMCIRKVAKWK